MPPVNRLLGRMGSWSGAAGGGEVDGVRIGRKRALRCGVETPVVLRSSSSSDGVTAVRLLFPAEMLLPFVDGLMLRDEEDDAGWSFNQGKVRPMLSLVLHT